MQVEFSSSFQKDLKNIIDKNLKGRIERLIALNC